MRHRRSSQAWWEMAFEKPFARWLRGRQTCERGNDGIIAQDDAPERRPVRYALHMLRDEVCFARSIESFIMQVFHDQRSLLVKRHSGRKM